MTPETAFQTRSTAAVAGVAQLGLANYHDKLVVLAAINQLRAIWRAAVEINGFGELPPT